jgi:ABC-type multidrug transport system fused ATPase/permease subunit
MTFGLRPEWLWLCRESVPFLRFQIASLICISASSAAGLIQPLLMKWMIDDVLPNGRWRSLALIAALFLGAGVARSALGSLGRLMNMIGVKRMAFRAHMRLVRHVQSRSAGFHARHPVGDLLQRLERDINLIVDFASDALPSIARTIVGSLMVVATMSILDWRLSAVVLPLIPLYVYARHRYRLMLRHCADAVREASGRQSSALQEMIAGAVQIQLLGAERRLARDYTRMGLTTIHREILQRRHELSYAVMSAAVVAVATAAVVGYGGFRVWAGELTIGGLVAFYGYLGTIFAPVNSAVGLFARVIRTHASIRRLIEIEQSSEAIEDAPDATPLASPPRVLAWKNVSFDYAPHKPVLQHVDLEVRAGERVAIIGESGSGKSSLLTLAVRLHDATAGRIEIDGRDIRTVRLESLRRAVSFVPQDPVLFQRTLRENVRYGCASATPEEIEHAAWIACLTEVVDGLPHGWDTELGRMGAGLSGGERQRIAIARALLQRRPILVLDEAFSALDGALERRLLSRLDVWARDRILILVSHRIETARWADRVVVLGEGRVVEHA